MARCIASQGALLLGFVAALAGQAAAQERTMVTRPPERVPVDQWPEYSIQQQIRQIAEQRPREAEAAARAFLHHIAQGRESVLDSLRSRDEGVYWHEVAQLTVQFDMLQGAFRRDSVRAGLLGQLFGTEFTARDIQRTWRSAGEPQREEMRRQLTTLMSRHFDVEEQLRMLEMRDIAQRLQAAQAESERRRQRRAELVRWAVEDVIRGAERP